MDLVSKNAFLEWAAARGLTAGVRPDSVWSFGYAGGTARRVRCEAPYPPGQLTPFLTRVFSVLAPDKEVFVFRAGLGFWHTADHVPKPPRSSGAYDKWMTGCGLLPGSRGAARCRREEFDVVLALVLSALVFTWTEAFETYVVPDHARWVLETDLDGGLWVTVPDETEAARVLAGLAAAAYSPAKSAEAGQAGITHLGVE